MGTILEAICLAIGGHRMGSWTPFPVPESQYARFEHAQCRWCHQWYVRPQRLDPL